MTSAVIIVVLVCCSSVMAVIPSRPVYLYPEHRSEIRPMKEAKEISTNAYDFQIIPSDQYPVAEYDNSIESSIIEYISFPITAIATVASKALSVGKWILVNGAMVFFGMAIVLGFCGLTPYCTIVIEKPFSVALHNLNIPYLDDVEYYVHEAYNKYRSMQD